MMNLEQARFNMIEQQIRPWNVLDPQVLELLTVVKRENFLPPHQKSLAFMDTDLPLTDGSLMLSPKVEARILQEVAVKEQDNVLVVGVGTGYLSALLAVHARQVICVESSLLVHAAAHENLEQQAIHKVSLELGNATKGWPQEAPYDVIVVTGSMPVLSEELKQQLKIGGRLFVVLGVAPVMTAYLVTRRAESGPEQFNLKPLFETHIAALPHAQNLSSFSF